MARREFSAGIWQAWFPTWTFFSSPGMGLRVEVRLDGASWQEAFIARPRTIWNIFFNPAENGRLLCLGAFERLLQESQDYLDRPHLFQQTLTYRLALAILKEEIGSQKPFQFRVLTCLQSNDQFGEAFLSGLHSC